MKRSLFVVLLILSSVAASAPTVDALQGNWTGLSRAAMGSKFSIKGSRIRFNGCGWLSFEVLSSGLPATDVAGKPADKNLSIAIKIHNIQKEKCAQFPFMNFELNSQSQPPKPLTFEPCEVAWITFFASTEKTTPKERGSAEYSCKPN